MEKTKHYPNLYELDIALKETLVLSFSIIYERDAKSLSLWFGGWRFDFGIAHICKILNHGDDITGDADLDGSGTNTIYYLVLFGGSIHLQMQQVSVNYSSC